MFLLPSIGVGNSFQHTVGHRQRRCHYFLLYHPLTLCFLHLHLWLLTCYLGGSCSWTSVILLFLVLGHWPIVAMAIQS